MIGGVFKKLEPLWNTKWHIVVKKWLYFTRFFQTKTLSIEIIFFQIVLLILLSHRVYSIFLLRPIEIMNFSLFDTPYPTSLHSSKLFQRFLWPSSQNVLKNFFLSFSISPSLFLSLFPSPPLFLSLTLFFSLFPFSKIL